MNVKSLAVLLLGCLAMLFLAASPASAAPACTIALLNATTPPDLNAEGVYERGADVVISGLGCFTSGTVITVGYNAVITLPTSIGLGDKGKYWNISDSTESLSVAAISLGTQVVSTGTVSDINITIDVGTDNPAAYLVLENLRFDVTGSTCTSDTPPCQSVADGHSLNAVVGTTNPTSTLLPFDIGNVKKTVAAAGVYDIGWGFEDGVCPFSSFCGYPNKGATSGSLINQAWWYLLTNSAWVTDFPFRRSCANGDCSPNAADPFQSLGPTDLVIDVENIMAGVTVSLPSSLIACGEGGRLAEWDFVGGSQTATGGDLVGVYATTYSNLTQDVYLTVGTTNGPADPGCDVTSFYPLISVQIGNPSGNSKDGTMQAYLRVVMGTAYSTAQFTGDDVARYTVPRYLNSIVSTQRPTRSIIGTKGLSGVNDDETVPYFYLNPTQTVLLYPYVTNLAGWDTGIEVGNTGNDSTIFDNTGQNGALDFYFFPSGAAPFEHTVTYADQTGSGGSIRGLDASGNLDAGGDFAATLNGLLTAAGHAGSFDGYVIVVAHFNFGHGTSLFFDASGGNTAVPALILGGHCSYNPNQAPPIPSTGAPQWPACSSARQGDITKLPERLEN